MHHLIADIGWPTLVLAALILACAAREVVSWVRHELRLARRVNGVPYRTREGWPYW